MGRRCTRRFVLLAEGGVKVLWSCGAALVVANETAVDLEYLADHLPTHHHHKHHLTHKEPT